MNNILLLIRLLISILLLFFTNFPLYIKIFALIFLDTVDFKTITQDYHYNDKIYDSFIYILLTFIIYKQKIFSKNITNFIIGLLLFRLIGTYLFLNQNNRKFLFYFPNFFLEITLLFSITKQLKLNKYLHYLIPLVFFFKIIQEYNLHYKKNI
jgi:hypothetical protein